MCRKYRLEHRNFRVHIIQRREQEEVPLTDKQIHFLYLPQHVRTGIPIYNTLDV